MELKYILTYSFMFRVEDILRSMMKWRPIQVLNLWCKSILCMCTTRDSSEEFWLDTVKFGATREVLWIPSILRMAPQQSSVFAGMSTFLYVTCWKVCHWLAKGHWIIFQIIRYSPSTKLKASGTVKIATRTILQDVVKTTT